MNTKTVNLGILGEVELEECCPFTFTGETVTHIGHTAFGLRIYGVEPHNLELAGIVPQWHATNRNVLMVEVV